MHDPNHTKFLSHLDASSLGVNLVAQRLSSLGHSVRIPPSSRAEKREDWRQHADEGDLFIESRVEVKHLSVNFSCPEDWPFGSKFIVCAKHSWDMAKPKPYAYYIVSADGKNMAVVPGWTRSLWYTESRKDSRYDNVTQDFFFCPLGHVNFIRTEQ